jgi:hypothetical protein
MDEDKLLRDLQRTLERTIPIAEKGQVNLKAQIALSAAHIDMLNASQAAISSRKWRLFDYIRKKVRVIEER